MRRTRLQGRNFGSAVCDVDNLLLSVFSSVFEAYSAFEVVLKIMLWKKTGEMEKNRQNRGLRGILS